MKMTKVRLKSNKRPCEVLTMRLDQVPTNKIDTAYILKDFLAVTNPIHPGKGK